MTVAPAHQPEASKTTDEPAPTPWLGPAEQECWQTFLTVHRAVFAALEADLQRNAGMPLAYYSILVTLSEAPDHMLRMGQLAGQLRSSSSSLTHAIARMHSCGWVERHNDPTDRRAQFAALTDAGLQVLADAAPGHVAAVRRHLFDALGPQQVKQLQKINQAIIDAQETSPGTEQSPAHRLAT
jgi:DNA-binding MarR family transcriptional regulator